MTNTHKEQMSSLLDGELNSLETPELLKALAMDQGLNEKMDRYSLIRDALNEDVVIHQDSFLKSVQDALVVEPTVLAPNREKRQNKAYIATAIAASVVFFTVVIFDASSLIGDSPTYQSVASLEEEQDRMLASEEMQNELFQTEQTLDVELVTFEK